MSQSTDQVARQRAALVVQVQSGVITVAEAARQLGISRKSYYQWERKALQAMVEALRDRPGGRPTATPDPEKEALVQQNRQLQEKLQVLEDTQLVHRVMSSPYKKS